MNDIMYHYSVLICDVHKTSAMPFGILRDSLDKPAFYTMLRGATGSFGLDFQLGDSSRNDDLNTGTYF